MKQLLVFVLLLVAYQSRAQNPAQTSARLQPEDIFGRYLHEVHRSDSLARLTHELQRLDQLQGDSLPAAYFSNGRYQLLYLTTSGWSEYVGRPRTSSNRKFIGTAPGKLFTGRELFRLSDLQNQDSTVLRYYPLVFAREDKYNRRWTPIAPNAHCLVLRCVFSYPNGNATSGYHEQRYYFERVN